MCELEPHPKPKFPKLPILDFQDVLEKLFEKKEKEDRRRKEISLVGKQYLQFLDMKIMENKSLFKYCYHCGRDLKTFIIVHDCMEETIYAICTNCLDSFLDFPFVEPKRRNRVCLVALS